MAPCFYGIDMSTVRELFAPRFIKDLIPTREEENAMARELGADSFRYLPVTSIASALDKPESNLCRACVTGEYPTETGERLYQLSLIHNNGGCAPGARTYEVAPSPVTP
jgi:amidophosphoribosyltransferase